MKALTIDEIRQAVHGRWLARGEVTNVRGVTTDSRNCVAGDLFVALGGPRYDGHAFVTAAAEAGCVSAIVAMDAELSRDQLGRFSGGVIGAANTTEALGELAGFYRTGLPATVIAVTGSNGKTTVKRMIHHILSRRLRGTCSPASFNNAVGVPLTLLAAEAGDDYVVCELGSSAPGEIASLAKIAGPDIAVITSVGPTHLERLGDVQRVAVEKASILSRLRDRGLAVVAADSEPLDRAIRSYECRMIRFGEAESCQLRLGDYQALDGGQRFRLNGRRWVELPLLGRHNARNALAAIAVAQRMGIEQDFAADALADFGVVEMRMERLDVGGVTVINDAYNANPASVLAAAEALGDMPGKRRVIVLGDMRELGPTEKDLHLQLGRSVAAGQADLLIGVGPLGRYIAKGAAEAGLAVETFSSVKRAGTGLVTLLRPGDAVLIKGSRAMEMERLIEPIRRAFVPARPKRKRNSRKV